MTNESTYSVTDTFKVLKKHGIVSNIEVVRRWLRQGKLEGIAPTTRRDGWRVSQSALDSFIAAHSINTTNLIALKKELHQLRSANDTTNTTSIVVNDVNEISALQAHIDVLQAEHAKELESLKVEHMAEIEALRGELIAELRETMQHEVDMMLENEREALLQLKAGMVGAIDESAIRADQIEREWYKYFRMGFVNDMIEIKKTHVKDALEHLQISGSYATRLQTEIWSRLEKNNWGRGKQIKIAVLDGYFMFEGKRIKLSDSFALKYERVLYPIIDVIRHNK